MKTLKKLLFLLAGICLLLACSKSDQFLGGDLKPTNLNKAGLTINKGDVFQLSGGNGGALYRTWEVIGGKVWQDGNNPCTAELKFLDSHNFIFTFVEPPKPPIPCYGKMGDSGTLTFKYPVPLEFPGGFTIKITDLIQMHGCATIWGEGINEGTLVFKGKFDGTRFTAIAKFMASVMTPCPMWGDAEINGNLHWTFGYDLNVVE
jgi:hypothetical protein